MSFHIQWSLCLLSSSLLFASCSDQSADVSPEDDTTPETEKVYPVDFRCITLNSEGSGGDKPSISYIRKDGTIHPNYFKDVNLEEMVPNPRSATQIAEKLYVTHNSYWPVQSQKWAQNGIFVMNPNTFVCERDINLGSSFMPSMVQSLGGDSVMVVGDDKKELANIIIGDIDNDSETFVRRQFKVDFPVSRVVRVGNKLVVSGNKKQKNGLFTYSQVGVFDLNALQPDKLSVLAREIHLSSRNSSILVDKHQRIWFGTESANGFILQCIDLTSGKTIHQVAMPYTVSLMNELAFTMDNRGENIYLRSHKAFFVVNVDQPSAPDEPVFEYLASVGVLNDLQVTREGHLLFLNEEATPLRPSELIEVRPQVNQPWEIVRVEKIGCVAKSIYVARYEK